VANFTLQQLEDFLGVPIVLFSFWNSNQKKVIEITLEGLPQTAQQAVITFINNHVQ